MGWTERVDSMLQARGRRAIKCTGLTAFFVAVAIDAAAVVLLREAPALVEELKDEPLVDPPLWTPAALLAGLPTSRTTPSTCWCSLWCACSCCSSSAGWR